MARSKRAADVPQSLLLSGGAMPVTASYLFPGIPEGLTAGIDEAGRGCLAGPVVAAAVILPAGAHIEGLDDSKKVPETRRAGLAAQIGATAVAWSLGVVWPQAIDEINILQATFRAMSRATATLKTRPAALLVDGNQTIPEQVLEALVPGAALRQKAIVDGDALVPVISAASILAKTFRDQLMEALDRRYPVYGFAKHKGYGTREHLAALREAGPCRLHRLSFTGVLPEKPAPPTLQEQGRLW